MASQSPAQSTVIGDDFELIHPLGRGGMGVLWVARQRSTGRQRALKLLRSDLLHDARERERFLNEATRTSAVVSDHVVEVIAAGFDTRFDAPWIAMELLDGETLTAWRARVAEVRGDALRELLGQLCHGLGACHDAGLVHCDLKPDNVFVARARRGDVRFTVKLLDYGIARTIDGSRTSSLATEAIATPLWAAPEQLEAPLRITHATDVWALGLLAFYVVTGRSYWRCATGVGAPVMAFLAELSRGATESASLRAQALGCCETLPPGFDLWFQRCLERDARDRYPSAREAWLALDDILARGSTSARAPPSLRTTPLSVASWIGAIGIVAVGVIAGALVRRVLVRAPPRYAAVVLPSPIAGPQRRVEHTGVDVDVDAAPAPSLVPAAALASPATTGPRRVRRAMPPARREAASTAAAVSRDERPAGTMPTHATLPPSEISWERGATDGHSLRKVSP